MSRKILFALVLMLLLPGVLLAGVTGKIRGKVTDKETGEVLPGANVVIANTTMGAAADINGQFVILRVPAGVYTLRANFIGYRDVEISNIKVSSDLTTEVNFELPPEALAGEMVTIVAERPLVNKNATNAVRIQGYEEFKNVPLRNVQAVVALQPGVVVQDGVVYVRGGRRDEVGYFLEGASTRDAVTGNNVVTVIPEAIEEFQVQAGGYNAEYGGANAGIIRSTLRSGTPNYRLSLQAETDNFADPGEKFLDTYSYGYSDYTTTISGPVPFTNKKVKFFFAGQNTFQEDRVVRFWKGFDFNHAPSFVDETTFPLVTTNFLDTLKQGLHMVDGNIPNASLNRWIGSGTLVYDFHPFQLRFSSNVSWQRTETVANFNNLVNLLNLDRTGVNYESNGLYSLKFTHVVSPKTYYEITGNFLDRRTIGYDPFMKHNFYAYFDSIANADLGYQFKSWKGANVGGSANQVDIYGFDFNVPGTPAGYGKTKNSYWGGAFNFTSQMKNHEVRFGGDYQRWTVRSYNLNTQLIFTNMINFPDQFRKALAGDAAAVGELRTAARINNWGYDIFGNEIDDNQFGLDGPKHPKYFSAYLQDRFEAKQLVINAGLRLDYIDNDDYTFQDPTNPDWDPELHSLILSDLQKKKAFMQVSPRLGLAFPATDRTVFHVQYGKFVQAPSLNTIYRSESAMDIMFTGGFFITQPTGFGLDPQRTTQYEIGFNHQFTDNASFDITVFYKDIQDWITTGRIQGGPTSRVAFYNILQNGDFATTKGIEFNLTMRRTNRVAAQVNYSYSSSLGTGSAPLTSIAGTEQGTNVPTIINPLDFDQPHRGSINFDYRFGKGDGGPILEQSGLNLLMTFNSGHPYTRRSGAFGQQDASVGGVISDSRNRNPLEAVNSSLTPWNYELNLRLDKTVNIGPFGANFYVYFQNLTNRRNVINVYERTGNAWDDGFRSDTQTSEPVAAANGGENFWRLYQAINLSGNGHNYSRVWGRLLFGTPRQIRFGVRLEY